LLLTQHSPFAIRQGDQEKPMSTPFQSAAQGPAEPLVWERVDSTGKAMVPLVFRARVPGGYLVSTQWGSGPFQTTFVASEHEWHVKLHGSP
jgi:hypothetical protein